ncbi:hypothetical protein EYS09_22175, partial [Streptomyces kasugaensis]
MILLGILRETIAPFRGMRFFAGSKVLLAPVVRTAMRLLSTLANAPSDGDSAKKSGAKRKGGKGSAGGGSKDDADSSPKAAKGAGSSGDHLERFGILAFALLIGFAVIASTARAVVAILAPYSAYVPYALGATAFAWVVVASAVAPPKKEQGKARKEATLKVDLEKLTGEGVEVDEPTPQNDHEKFVGETHSSDDTEADRIQAADIWLTRLVITAVLDATRAGRRGIHLATILTSTPSLGWEVATLRGHLDRLHLPYRRTLNIRGVGNTSGIHVDDLEEALGTPLTDALSSLPDTPLAPL